MWRLAAVIGIFVGGFAVQTQAEGVKSSIYPKARPEAQVGTSQLVVSTSDPSLAPRRATVQPQHRPTIATPPPEQIVQIAAYLPRSLVPKVRPEQLIKAAVIRTVPGAEAVVSPKGSVCGDPTIKGQNIPPITARVKGCGVSDPVKITSIAGVKLSQAASIDCTTAKALKKWVVSGLQPAFGNKGVVQLQVAGSYTCRSRNNVSGAKVSEHGKGHAIDISGIVLSDGSKLTVARDFRRVKALKAAYKSACGTFGTTLGPGSDGYHEDHMHFDTARYRSGAYCH